MVEEELEKINGIFAPYALQKFRKITDDNTRFVHYTSAEAAINIIKNQEIWMRNAKCMNDFMEIEYGLRCLREAYNKSGREQFRNVLDRVSEGLAEDIEKLFDSWTTHFKINTYLTCISEHQNNEDEIGRLSMWRAYGKTTGVALVLNNKVFLTPTDALLAYTYPVAYLKASEVEDKMLEIVKNMENEIKFLSKIDREIIKNRMFEMFKFVALCVKHPGFREEREWRVVYSPTMRSSKYLEKEITTIGGVPQHIYKIPLKNRPEEGLDNIEVNQLINRIIIGPTDYPLAVYQAFQDLLEKAGVEEPSNKIYLSDIPLRKA